jgi:hypothetical protein
MSPEWIDSTAVLQPGTNLVTGEEVIMVWSTVGYVGDRNGPSPIAGRPYLARIVVGVNDPRYGYVSVQTRVVLPRDTRFDFSQGRIECYLLPPGSREPIPITDDQFEGRPVCAPTGGPNGDSGAGQHAGRAPGRRLRFRGG